MKCIKTFLWYFNMSSIDLASRFKMVIYLLNREKRCNAFPRSTDKIQVLNELPTNIRHIKETQDVMPYTRRQQKNRFSKKK